MRATLLCLIYVTLGSVSLGNEPTREAKIKDAIERGLKVVTRGAKAYPEHRQCFSCHHQLLPMQAMAIARDYNHKIDSAVFNEQFKFTQTFFDSKKDTLARGDRVGGAAATVSYGLWTYDIAKSKPDDTTKAMVANLLKLQRDDGHWQPPSHRPPLEESSVSCTVLSAYGVQLYAGEDHKVASEEAFTKAGKWLDEAKLESTEDLAFALLWYACFQDNEERAETIRKTLLGRQREDGGWGQRAETESDAYATGQAVYYLSLTAGLRANFDAQVQKGKDYLVSTQEADGSWHVKTRSKPVQKFFDNGDPHGADQFISIAATSWATAALAFGPIELPPGSKSP
jgi:N-acyl-D-amino-acid deacylase